MIFLVRKTYWANYIFKIPNNINLTLILVYLEKIYSSSKFLYVNKRIKNYDNITFFSNVPIKELNIYAEKSDIINLINFENFITLNDILIINEEIFNELNKLWKKKLHINNY